MSAPTLLETVERNLSAYGAINESLVVGLSGGLDSVVLLDALVQLRDTEDLRQSALSAIHVHHGLSPNADEWARFCEQLCRRFEVPLTVCRVSVAKNGGGGIEAAARNARYAAFASIDAKFIALGQHLDDQAETVIHELLRGTGLQGMAGMGAQRALSERQTLIRPLLSLTREQIERTAGERGLQWIEDESNLDIALTRNFLRHEVMPLIESRFPHYRESFARVGRHSAQAGELNEALARIDLDVEGESGASASSVRVGRLDTLTLARQCNALYWWLRWCKAANVSEEQLKEWARVLFRPSPTDKPHQAGGHDFVILRRRDRLFFSLHV